MMSLSAAICTRHRPVQLERALHSLQAQREPLSEILVVDNAPTDDATRRLVQDRFPGVRYIREPRQGLDIARNRALRESRGDLVAFLDDDAVADPVWSRHIRQVFAADPSVAICTSRVEALALDTDAQRLFEANGGFSRGLDRIHLPHDAHRPLHGHRAPLIAWAVSVGNGASFAVRRQAILTLGGFDEALDRGEALPGGGDLDIFWRALQAGHGLVYEPAVLAWHEHRRELAEVARQLAGHQRAVTAFLLKTVRTSRGRQQLSVLVFLAWRLLKPSVRLLRRLAGRDPLPAWILRRMAAAAVGGLWAYPAAQEPLVQP